MALRQRHRPAEVRRTCLFKAQSYINNKKVQHSGTFLLVEVAVVSPHPSRDSPEDAMLLIGTLLPESA